MPRLPADSYRVLVWAVSVSDAEQPPLRDLIAAAIADHLAPEGGGFVTAFHLAVEYTDIDGNQCHIRAYPEGQRATVTMGLLEWELGVARYEQRRHLDDVTDE